MHRYKPIDNEQPRNRAVQLVLYASAYMDHLVLTISTPFQERKHKRSQTAVSSSEPMHTLNTAFQQQHRSAPRLWLPDCL